MKASIPLARPVLEAAADWHVRLKFDADDNLETTAQLAEEHAQWLAANEQHRRAWALVERMDQQLCQLPQEASLSALNTNRPTQLHRRTVLGGLILLAGGASLGWSTYEQSLWHSWVADYRTAAGQHQVIQLADGGRVDLNTASALAADDDSLAFQNLDDNFHQTLAGFTQYPRVASFIEAEKAHMDRVRNLSLHVSGQYKRILNQHAAIIKAIKAGSAEKSAAAMSVHLKDVYNILELIPQEHPEYFI